MCHSFRFMTVALQRLPMRCLIVAAGLLLPGSLVQAADRAEAIEVRLRACAAEADDAQRLVCFDALVPVATSPEQPPAAPIAANPERNFGVETLPPRFDAKGEAVDAITSRIDSLQRRPYGEYVFELANGQRWTQIESSRARYSNGQLVTIERTTLGAYMLSTDQGRATRVRRLD